jgi:hypothetical protein
MKASELANLLQKMGARRVYIADDKAGNTFSSIERKTITFTRHAVFLYPYRSGQYPDENEDQEYHIADMD